MRKKIVFLISSILLPLNLSSCNKTSSTIIDEISSISTVDSGGIEIFRMESVGVIEKEYIINTAEFDVIVKNKDGNINSSITRSLVSWKIEDENIAKVDSKGFVTVKKGGETKLTASYNNYSTSIDIKTALFTKEFEYDDTIYNYKIGNEYKMPLILSTKDYVPTIFYTLSNDEIIRVIDDNKFIALKDGIVSVHAEAFINYKGDKDAIDFNIEVKDIHAPYFKINNLISTYGKGTITKNKYQSIPFSELGIKAYRYNDYDISNTISVISGEYNLNKSGEYEVILSVTDSEYLTSSNFKLKLTVSDYEIVKKLSPIDALEATYYQPELIRSSSSSSAVNKIKFKMDVKLNDKYDTSDAKVSVYFYFSIYNWGKYRKYDYEGNGLTDYKYFEYNGERKLSFECVFSPGVDLNPDTFNYVSSQAVISGYVYNFVKY